jgi:hypothetical protein
VRPLLGCGKEQLLAALQESDVAWLDDASNASPAYARNRLRLQLLPRMRELTPGDLDRRLAELAEQSAQLRELLDAQPRVYTVAAAGGAGPSRSLQAPSVCARESEGWVMQAYRGRQQSASEILSLSLDQVAHYTNAMLRDMPLI